MAWDAFGVSFGGTGGESELDDSFDEFSELLADLFGTCLETLGGAELSDDLPFGEFGFSAGEFN